jgi:uncharacterized protein (DUF2141 family)
MKMILTAFLLLQFIAGAAQSNTVNLAIEINGIQPKGGHIYIALYNSAKTYLDTRKIYKSEIVKVASENFKRIAFNNISSGQYAIAVFLDQNGNSELDTNFLGIPTEQYGFSGEKLPRFRAPKFHEAAFEVLPGENKVKINLR